MSKQVIEHCGRDLGIDTGLIGAAFTTANPAVTRDTVAPQTLKAAQKYARKQYLACVFLLRSDRKTSRMNSLRRLTSGRRPLRTHTACSSIGNKTLATSYKLLEQVATTNTPHLMMMRVTTKTTTMTTIPMLTTMKPMTTMKMKTNSMMQVATLLASQE